MRLTRWVSVALLVMVASAQGQQQSGSGFWPNPPFCETCVVKAGLDVPSVGSTVSATPWATYAAGWAFRCYDGALPTKVDVQFIQSGQTYTVPISLTQNVPRPDVYDAFIGGCAVGGTTGYHAYLSAGIPIRGTAIINVVTWVEGIQANHWRTVTVVD
jgi:hypothetical protein